MKTNEEIQERGWHYFFMCLSNIAMNGYNKVGVSGLVEVSQETCSGAKNKPCSSAAQRWPPCGLLVFDPWTRMAAFHTTYMHRIFLEDARYEALEGWIRCFFPAGCFWAAAFSGYLLYSWLGSSPPGPGTSVVPGHWSSAPNRWDTRADGIIGAAQRGAWEEGFFQFLPLPSTSQCQCPPMEALLNAHLWRAELLLPQRKVWERSRWASSYWFWSSTWVELIVHIRLIQSQMCRSVEHVTIFLNKLSLDMLVISGNGSSQRVDLLHAC